MPPNPPKSPSLESWVVTSTVLDKDKRDTKEPRPNHGDSNTSGSLTTSSSSISGPELIMPSIYEVAVSESSWVAPNIRARDGASPTPRRRHQPPKDQTKENHNSSPNEHTRPAVKAETQRDGIMTRALNSKTIRTVLNSVLILGILHLLVLPELVYQCDSLCAIPAISTLYSSSCIPSSQSQFHTQNTRYKSVLTTQTRLESLFNTTLAQTTPFANHLRESDARLHSVAGSLKKTYPGRKNELDLEFGGCWKAVRAAIRKFDTLIADMHSAVDSLLAAGSLNPGSDPVPKGKGRKEISQVEVAKETRLSTQIQRRKQYLEQLAGRMRSKAESLSADLSVLDDHLESIGDIVNREYGWGVYSESNGSTYLRAVISILPERLVSFFQSNGQSSGNGASPQAPVADMLKDAVSRHRRVAAMVRNLSSRLQDLQRLQD